MRVNFLVSVVLCILIGHSASADDAVKPLSKFTVVAVDANAAVGNDGAGAVVGIQTKIVNRDRKDDRVNLSAGLLTGANKQSIIGHIGFLVPFGGPKKDGWFFAIGDPTLVKSDGNLWTGGDICCSVGLLDEREKKLFVATLKVIFFFIEKDIEKNGFAAMAQIYFEKKFAERLRVTLLAAGALGSTREKWFTSIFQTKLGLSIDLSKNIALNGGVSVSNITRYARKDDDAKDNTKGWTTIVGEAGATIRF